MPKASRPMRLWRDIPDSEPKLTREKALAELAKAREEHKDYPEAWVHGADAEERYLDKTLGHGCLMAVKGQFGWEQGQWKPCGNKPKAGADFCWRHEKVGLEMIAEQEVPVGHPAGEQEAIAAVALLQRSLEISEEQLEVIRLQSRRIDKLEEKVAKLEARPATLQIVLDADEVQTLPLKAEIGGEEYKSLVIQPSRRWRFHWPWAAE